MAQKKIYVGNLSYGTSQDRLNEVFSEFGELEDVRLIIDRDTKRSKGFAFLTYTEADAAQKAVDSSPIELDGRQLRINIAEDRPRSNSGFNKR